MAGGVGEGATILDAGKQRSHLKVRVVGKIVSPPKRYLQVLHFGAN